MYHVPSLSSVIIYSYLRSPSLVSTSGQVPAETMGSRVKQPKESGLSSLFSCCFNRSDPPEITHCQDSTTPTAVLEPNLPMPPVQELDTKFTELVVSERSYSQCLQTSKFSSFPLMLIILPPHLFCLPIPG